MPSPAQSFVWARNPQKFGFTPSPLSTRQACTPASSDTCCAQVVASIVIVCAGVGVSTVSDTDLGSNYLGWAVGAGAVAATAAYQIWAGTKQKELGAGSMQLLEQYAPIAAFMLFVLVPICEPMGWTDRSPGTLLGYEYSPPAVWLVSFKSITLLPSLLPFRYHALGPGFEHAKAGSGKLLQQDHSDRALEKGESGGEWRGGMTMQH